MIEYHGGRRYIIERRHVVYTLLGDLNMRYLLGVRATNSLFMSCVELPRISNLVSRAASLARLIQ